MKFDPAAALARYHADLNALDWSRIATAFAPDATYVSHGVGALAGREAILSAFRAWFAEYPDQVAVDEAIESTGPLTARAVWRLSATSAITGLHLERRGTETAEFDPEGRITRIEVTDETA